MESQVFLGEMYHKGTGVTKDYTKAIYWYGKAAEQGHAKAAENRKSLLAAISVPSRLPGAKAGEWIEYDVTELMNGNFPIRERFEILAFENDSAGKQLRVKVTLAAMTGGEPTIMDAKEVRLEAVPAFIGDNYFDWCPKMLSGVMKHISSQGELETSVGKGSVSIKGKKFNTNILTIGRKKGEMEYFYLKFHFSSELPASGLVRVELLSHAENSTVFEMSNYGWSK